MTLHNGHVELEQKRQERKNYVKWKKENEKKIEQNTILHFICLVVVGAAFALAFVIIRTYELPQTMQL